MNLDDGHEIVVSNFEELCDKYPEHKDEICVYMENMLSESMKSSEKKIEELAVRVQLYDSAEILPLSYIAKSYFKKTKSWLYQRVNENIVNGKPVKFSTSEKVVFNNALQDISKRIGSINII